MALDNLTSHFSTMLETTASAIFLSSLSIIHVYSFVFLHVRTCALFICYCPTCEKTRFNDNFFLRRVLCSNLKRTCRLSFFRKKHPPCNTNLQWRITWLILGMRKTAREAAELCGVTELIAELPRARSARVTEPHTHGIWSTSFRLVVTWLNERTYVRTRLQIVRVG